AADERRAPDSGHPRGTPASRPPLQIERRAPDSGHPRGTPASRPPALDHRLASDGGAPAPRCPTVRNAMTPLEPDAPGYPALLRAVPSPPALWVRGALATDDALAVAIVGARRATPYGLATAERIAAELGARGVTIVSGFARGIDTAAHRGALEAGGRTLAVLGCGIDVVYPSENRALVRAIEARGALCAAVCTTRRRPRRRSRVTRARCSRS